jgi:hypothetical protein
MSNEITGGGGRYRIPGDYELHELTIENIDGATTDIRMVYNELNLYEDMFQHVMQAEVAITDSTGLAANIPIMGEEKLHIDYGLRDSSTTSRYVFRIVEMSRMLQVNDTTWTYVLNCISEEHIINLQTKIQKSYKGKSTTEIVKDIYSTYIAKGGRGSKKPLYLPVKGSADDSPTPLHIIIPNWSPFTAINFCSARSGPPDRGIGTFVFYETVHGFYFRSIESMLNPSSTTVPSQFKRPDDVNETPNPHSDEISELQVKELSKSKPSEQEIPAAKYVWVPEDVDVAAAAAGDRMSAMQVSVNSFSIDHTFNILENLSFGMYSSQLITHDLIRMKIGFKSFGYDTAFEYDNIQTGRNSFLNVKESGEGGRKAHKLSSGKLDALGSPESVVKFMPTNMNHTKPFYRHIVRRNADKKQTVYRNNVEEWLQPRLSQLQQLENVILRLEVPGDPNRRVGEIIEFEIPDPFDPETDHRYYTGNYLVSRIQHRITPFSYSTTMRIVKDSLYEPLVPEWPVTTLSKLTDLSSRSQDHVGHGTMKGKDSEEALAISGRIKGQSGR